jgi:hypothetical protein
MVGCNVWKNPVVMILDDREERRLPPPAKGVWHVYDYLLYIGWYLMGAEGCRHDTAQSLPSGKGWV